MGVAVEAWIGFRRTLTTAAFVFHQHRRWLGASFRRSEVATYFLTYEAGATLETQ